MVRASSVGIDNSGDNSAHTGSAVCADNVRWYTHLDTVTRGVGS